MPVGRGLSLDTVRRGLGRRGLPQFGLQLPVFVFVCIALLILSRLDHSAVRQLRWQIAQLMAPALSAALVPLEPVRWAGRHVSDGVDLLNKLEEARDEAQRLKGWEWRAKELERKVAELSGLSKLVSEPSLEFVTARVIANSSGAFVRSVIINAGTSHRIKTGFPVLTGDGLVGRVVEAGPQASRVLMLTDLNSRIPVHVGPRDTRAILAGDNGPYAKLTFLLPDAEVNLGDEVGTSGMGGLLPRGLKIGVVAASEQGLRVKPDADLDAIEYISVLLYESPTPDPIVRDGCPTCSARTEGSGSVDGKAVP